MTLETALGFQYPQDTDAPNGPAELQQIAEKADGFAQSGGVATSTFITSGARTSNVFGAFGTPVKVELPRVKINQLVEIWAFGAVKSSIESNSGAGTGGKLAFSIGSLGRVLEEALFTINTGNLAANAAIAFISNGPSFLHVGATPVRGLNTAQFPVNPTLYVAEAEHKPLAIELVGLSTSGTITVENVWLAARVWG